VAAEAVVMADRDELAVFDDAVVDAAAADHDLSPDRLAEVVRAHQDNVRELPGVDDIVYEWRNYFHLDPMLARTEEAYYLALPDHVWDEFAEDLALDDDERVGLLAVHDRQARRDAESAGFDAGRLDGDAAVVLVRP
jgi:hypothetical protein